MNNTLSLRHGEQAVHRDTRTVFSMLEKLRGGMLDIRLPGMDGFEARRRLRADPVARDIPVVAVSANAMPADVAPARAAGVAGHVTKPLGLQRLLAVVVRVPGR